MPFRAPVATAFNTWQNDFALIIYRMRLLSFSAAAICLFAICDSKKAFSQDTCSYNDKHIGCVVYGAGDDYMTIEWSDGLTQTYTLVDQKRTYNPNIGRHQLSFTYMDKYSGLWHYYCNTPRTFSFLSHSSNGNSMEFDKCW